MMRFWRRWKEDFRERRQFATTKRDTFFAVAGEFLPKEPDSVVVDVGCGPAQFARQLKLAERFEHLYLLDGDVDLVHRLKTEFSKTIEYQAPSRLPFDDESVDFLHCSHLIEHLEFESLHELLSEMHRVLRPGGHLVISSPLLWDGFYGDIDHVRPYEPGAIVKHFCDRDGWVATGPISRAYTQMKTVYRYYARPDSGLGSENRLIDFFIQFGKAIAWKLGVRHYVRSGYTIALRKGPHERPGVVE